MKPAHHAALAELFGPLPFQRQLADALVVVQHVDSAGYTGPVALADLTIQLSPWKWLARTTRSTPATRRLTRLIAEALATDTWNIPYPEDSDPDKEIVYQALRAAADLRRFAEPDHSYLMMEGDEDRALPLQEWGNQGSVCLLPPDVPMHLVRLDSAEPGLLLLMLGAACCPGGGPIVVLQERKSRTRRQPYWQYPTFEAAYTVYLVDDTTGEWAAIEAEPEVTTDLESAEEDEGEPTGRLRPAPAGGISGEPPAWLNALHYIDGHLRRSDTGTPLRWAVHPRQVWLPVDSYRRSEWFAKDQAATVIRLGDAGADHPMLTDHESLAYLSADDPYYGSSSYPNGAENRLRNRQLRERLAQRNLTWTDAVRRPQDGGFYDAGHLVFDASIEQLVALAREFGQVAFMYLPRAGRATLWHCPPNSPAIEVITGA